jgi:hypothetical protein
MRNASSRALQRGRRIIVAVAQKGAATRRIEFDAKGIQPFARSNYALLFDLLGVVRLLVGFVRLKPAGMKRRAAPGDRFGIGFACHRRGEVCTGFFDAQFELPHSAETIGFGLRLRFAAGPFEIGQAPRERVTLKFSCACLPLQLREPGVVGQGILDAADGFASLDRGAGRRDRRSSDSVDRCTNHGEARIDNGVSANSDHELLIKNDHTCSEQHRAENEFAEPAPRQRPFAGSGQIRRTRSLWADFGR